MWANVVCRSRDERAGGGERGCGLGEHDLLDPKPAGDGDAVETRAAAPADHHGGRRVDPLRQCDPLDRGHHPLGGQFEDGGRSFKEIKLERLRDSRSSASRARSIETDISPPRK